MNKIEPLQDFIDSVVPTYERTLDDNKITIGSSNAKFKLYTVPGLYFILDSRPSWVRRLIYSILLGWKWENNKEE